MNNARWLVAAWCSMISAVTVAQYTSSELTRDTPAIDEELEKAAADQRGNFVAVPIPFSNPAIGTGLAAVGAYMYRIDPDDTETPASLTGIGGFYADSKSSGAGLAQKLYLKNDRIRVGFALLTTELNYDFYGIGSGAGDLGRSIALTQSGDGFGAQFEYRVRGDYFVGLRLGVADIQTAPDVTSIPPEFQSFELTQDSRIEDVGLLLTRDSRDHVYTPADGSLMKLNVGFRQQEGLNSSDYEKIRFEYNRYFSLENAVLAYRVYACYAGQGSPFFDLCAFGANDDLRGYTAGRYRDRAEVVTQLEYRRPISDRWGFVVFGGVGEVARSFSDMDAHDLLPGVGVGVRFMVSEAQRINLRVDVARGNDESTVHISVGEAF